MHILCDHRLLLRQDEIPFNKELLTYRSDISFQQAFGLACAYEIASLADEVNTRPVPNYKKSHCEEVIFTEIRNFMERTKKKILAEWACPAENSFVFIIPNINHPGIII